VAKNQSFKDQMRRHRIAMDELDRRRAEKRAEKKRKK